MKFDYELIITICNHGYSDEIMKSAKKAGARGGTIVHGRGTADEETIKFFGLRIHSEKELLLIVTNSENKKEIMNAIINNHGIDTEARALCFSMPVTELCGFNI